MIEDIKNALPGYAKDLKLNLSSLMREETLTPVRRYGALLAAALASGNSSLISAATQEASQHLTHEELENVRAANAMMAMTNTETRSTYSLVVWPRCRPGSGMRGAPAASWWGG